MNYRIDTAHGRIDYTLKHKAMKTMRIRITGASEVIVSAPHHAPFCRVSQFVHDNENFILSKLREIGDRRHKYYPSTYQSGDTFWHLGQKTELEVCNLNATRARLEDGILKLYVPQDADYRYKKALFILWSTRTARSVFAARLEAVAPAFADVPIDQIRISVKNVLGRWGSINTKRHTLSLSVHLLRCEVTLIDYVITHELCHYAHTNHNSAFYRLLERHFPNRTACDKRLSIYGLIDF